MKNRPIEKTLNELKNMHTKVFEDILKQIVKEPEKLRKCKEELFYQWIYILEFYKQILKKGEYRFTNYFIEYTFLTILVEGLVKIILFFNKPYEYLEKKKRERTIGSLTDDLTNLLKDRNKYEIELKYSLEIIKEIRNNVIHFPFYSSDDYRYKWLFFQVIAYLLESLSLWQYLNESDIQFIKEMALEKPSGVSLLEVDLYE